MCVMAFIALLHFVMRRTTVLLNNRPTEPLNEGVGFLVWVTVLFIFSPPCNPHPVQGEGSHLSSLLAPL